MALRFRFARVAEMFAASGMSAVSVADDGVTLGGAGLRPIPRPRERLVELLRERSFEKKRVVLASGRESDFFIDCKQTILTAEGHALTGELMFDALEAHYASEVAQDLARMREQAAISRAELGRRAHVPQAEISRILSGQRDPRASTLSRLAQSPSAFSSVRVCSPAGTSRPTSLLKRA